MTRVEATVADLLDGRDPDVVTVSQMAAIIAQAIIDQNLRVNDHLVECVEALGGVPATTPVGDVVYAADAVYNDKTGADDPAINGWVQRKDTGKFHAVLSYTGASTNTHCGYRIPKGLTRHFDAVDVDEVDLCGRCANIFGLPH